MNLKKTIKVALAKNDIEQVDIAKALGISPQAVSEWGRTGKIPEKHWDYIRNTLGFEPSEFRGITATSHIQDHTAIVSGTGNAVNKAKATGGSSINFTAGAQLPPAESRFNNVLLDPKEYEAIMLYRKVGVESTIEKFIAKLKEIDAAMQW